MALKKPHHHRHKMALRLDKSQSETEFTDSVNKQTDDTTTQPKTDVDTSDRNSEEKAEAGEYDRRIQNFLPVIYVYEVFTHNEIQLFILTVSKNASP